MKLIDNDTVVEQIGVSGHQQFRMKSSRKAFQILSDLYSDKPKALVQELGCNAKDSMVAAGKGDQPFLIHVPNSLEPYLIIQDFGTGISHENIYNIYNIYTTYFESTKTDTNDQIGCLGLGSKSPFCYTDNFLVTSVVDGVKRIYNAYFSENNMPTIALMSTEQTTEGNGLSVQIPIKKEDFDRFYTAIRKTFRFFANRPTIIGGDVAWSTEKPVFKGQGWESYDSFVNGEAYAIMGGVAYRIDLSKITEENNKFAQKGGIVLYFEMGELDFVPSREALSYDGPTIKALNDRIAFAFNDLQIKLSEEVATASNLLEAVQQVHSIKNRFGYIAQIDFSKLEWKGINVSNPVKLINDISRYGVTTHSYSAYMKAKYRHNSNVSLHKDTVWYVDDCEKGATSRIRTFLRGNNDAVISVFTLNSYNSIINNSDENLRIDASKFKLLSSLPYTSTSYVRSTKSGQSKKGRIKGSFNVYKFGDGSKVAWNTAPFDPSDPPKYYIVRKMTEYGWKININLPGFINNFSTKYCINKLCRALNISRDDVVMVAASYEDDLKYVGAVSFVDFVTSELNVSNINADDFATVRRYGFDKFDAMWQHPEFSKMDQTDPLVEFISKHREAKAKLHRYKSIIDDINSSPFQGTPLSLASSNPFHSFLLGKIGQYGWTADDVITVLKNAKK